MNTLSIEYDKSLADLNTLGVPARARAFVKTIDVDSTIAALTWAKNNALKVYTLGGGSNVVLEPLIEGLVIQPDIKGMVFERDAGDIRLAKVGAGEIWHDLVTRSVMQGFSGLENLALIPGSVGAAPIQNIGAYGVELKDRFVTLQAIDRHDLSVRDFSIDECRFGYRDSLFKSRARDRFIITHVTLRLRRGGPVVTHYPALKQALVLANIDRPRALDVMNTVIDIRRAKLPDPEILPNAGSFFKNPSVDDAQYQKLLALYPKLPAYPTGSRSKKLPAAWLIEHAGWKGRSSHDVHVHADHALVLTNPHHRNAEAILALAAEIQHAVLARFGITLEIEPQRLGAV